MSLYTPYPGARESYSSWDFRCKQAENDRARWNRELNARKTNWGGYNYHPVETGPCISYVMPDGSIALCEWVGRGNGHAKQARAYASRHGLAVKQVTIPAPGWGKRTDWLVLSQPSALELSRQARYSDDTPRSRE